MSKLNNNSRLNNQIIIIKSFQDFAFCAVVRYLINPPHPPPLSSRCTELSQSSVNVAWLLSACHLHTNRRTPALELGTAGTLHIHPVCNSRSFSVCVSLIGGKQLIFSHDTEVKILSFVQIESFS